MVFSELLSLKKRLMPLWAITQVDLEGLFKSKVTYGWLISAIFLNVVRVLGTSTFSTTSRIIAEGLSDFIYVWSMVIIGLTTSAVASEIGEFADSILSKAIRRYEYISAKFLSRFIYVLAIYFSISSVLIGLAIKMAKNDYEVNSLMASVLFVLLALIMLTTMGVMLGAVIPNTVIAMVLLLVFWYSMTFFFPIIDLGFLSPSNIINELPDHIQGVWNGEEWKTAIGFTLISLTSVIFTTLFFSTKDL